MLITFVDNNLTKLTNNKQLNAKTEITKSSIVYCGVHIGRTENIFTGFENSITNYVEVYIIIDGKIN